MKRGSGGEGYNYNDICGRSLKLSSPQLGMEDLTEKTIEKWKFQQSDSWEGDKITKNTLLRYVNTAGKR